MIDNQRALFDIPDDVTYLNCAYLGPRLKSVLDAGVAGIHRTAAPWNMHPEHFFDDTERVRELTALIADCSADDVALIPSVSYGIATAAANLPFGPGDEVVVLAEQFPSNVYVWRDLVKSRGAKLVTVPRPDDGSTAAVCDAMTERTAVVAISEVHWTDGRRIDLTAVREHAREAGAGVVLDLSQSLGALPFSFRDIDPDFVVACGYKWLLGPYGTTLLIANARHHNGTPIEYGWANRVEASDFSRLVEYRDTYQAGARRFDVGERSNFILLPMLIKALEQIVAWTPAGIAGALQLLIERLRDGARNIGLAVTPDVETSPHYTGVFLTGGTTARVRDAAAAEKIFVSLRGDAVRVSPHLYNSIDDIERLLTVLKRAA